MIILPVLSYRVGQKISHILIAFSVIIGNSVFYFSTNVTELIISLVLQGVLAGSMLTISLMFVPEYTSPKYRGIFLTCLCASTSWGIWVSNFIGTFYPWKNIGIVIFVCSVYNLSSIFCCESPYWLATKGRFSECAKVHRWLKGTDENSEEELRKLISSHQDQIIIRAKLESLTEVKKYVKLLAIVRSKLFYKPFMYVVLLVCLYNATGKMVCTVYAIDIIKKITSSEQTAYIYMLILDAMVVAGMYIGSAMSKIITRRKQLICFSSIGILFLYTLSIYLYVIKFKLIIENTYILLFLLTGYSICISGGPMILSPTCSAELYPFKYRNLFLCSISVFNTLFLATYVKIAPLIFRQLGTPGTFLFFALTSSVCIIVAHKYLPETKDKTIQEIEVEIVRGRPSDKNTVVGENIPLKEP